MGRVRARCDDEPLVWCDLRETTRVAAGTWSHRGRNPGGPTTRDGGLHAMRPTESVTVTGGGHEVLARRREQQHAGYVRYVDCDDTVKRILRVGAFTGREKRRRARAWSHQKTQPCTPWVGFVRGFFIVAVLRRAPVRD